MNEDTKEILEEIEQELLQEEVLEKIEQELLYEALLEDQKTELDFENPDVLETGPEPEVYSNFANDYGREQTQSAENGAQQQSQANDSVTIILMLISCILGLGIICVMLFWLQAWL